MGLSNIEAMGRTNERFGSSRSYPSTALWQPDMAPPNEWLYPAILYQDRISTIVPDRSYDREETPVALFDSLERSERLAGTLGDLYVPTRLSSSRMRLTDNWLPTLIDTVAREIEVLGSRADEAEKIWLELFRRDRQARSDAVDAQVLIRHKTELTLAARAAINEVRSAAEAAINEDLFEMRNKLESINAAWRLADSRGLRKEADSCRKSSQILQSEISSALVDSHTRQPFADLLKPRIDHHEETIGQLEQAQMQLAAAHSRATAVTREAGEIVAAVHRSLLQGGPAGGWSLAFASKMSDSFVPALRKNFGFIFPSDTLFYAPHRLMARLIDELATNHCAYNGWTPMSRFRSESGSTPYVPERDAPTVDPSVLCYQLALPSLDIKAPLEDVVAFRREHNDELLRMREMVAAMLHAAPATLEDLADLRSSVEAAVAEPLREINRALELKGNRVTTRAAAVVRSPSAAIPMAGRLLQQGSKSVLSAMFTGTAASAAIGQAFAPNALVVGAAAFSAQAAWSAMRARRADHVARQGPLAYLYEVHRAFG